MRIDFRQGIITYPISFGGQQQFLAKTGSYISLQTVNGRTDIAFAHGTENYLYTETTDSQNAWGPLTPNTDYWLYWDINLLTAVRTFGFTAVQPITGSIQPTGTEGLHWFNTATTKMYVFSTGRWQEVVRVFAAKVNNATFTPLGTGNVSKPFAGTQVGIITGPPLWIYTETGRIIADNTGAPIRRANGQFFTSTSDFFIDSSPVNAIRLESNIIDATADQNIARYQVVKYTQFGRVSLAAYDDTETTMIAVCLEDLFSNDTGMLCVQGVITNPAWNFLTVGAPLWISTAGALTETDPHVADPITYPQGKVPVGRVLTPTSIFFDQGLGGRGDKGDPGIVQLASEVVHGVSRLSLPPANPADPIVVGDNDPRLTSNIHPPTHPASIITTDTYKFLTGLNAQVQLHELADRTLHTISDVAIATPLSGDFLRWTGVHWANSALSISLSGDISGTGLSAITTTLSNTGVTPGTYNNVTVDSKGRITSGTVVNTLPYDIAFYIPSTPFDINTIISGYLSPRIVTVVAGVKNVAKCYAAPSTIPAVFNIHHNGTLVATVTFAVASNVGVIVFTAGSTIVVGVNDTLTVSTDTLVDPAISGIGITLVGTSSTV